MTVLEEAKVGPASELDIIQHSSGWKLMQSEKRKKKILQCIHLADPLNTCGKTNNFQTFSFGLLPCHYWGQYFSLMCKNSSRDWKSLQNFCQINLLTRRIFLVTSKAHRPTEWLRLEGTPGGQLVQYPFLNLTTNFNDFPSRFMEFFWGTPRFK